jgi:rSAM/selenodomain-associated transferase 1
MTTDGRETVLVVAKAPIPGRSKTRLVPPLDPEQAAALQRAMLLDTLDACRNEVGDVRLLHASDDEAPALQVLAPDVPLVLQRGTGLAAALEGGIADHVGSGPCLLVSSDVPGLPPGELRAACAALRDGADVVIGPAFDGGYWLIGMREARPEPFVQIPWSTPAVTAVTRERCAASGLRVAEVASWRDVDTVVDLAAMAASAPTLPGRRTAALALEVAPRLPDAIDVDLVGSELLAASPWRSVLRDRLLIDDRATDYAYLGVPRAVFVAAVTREREVLFVRQYRHPVRDWTLEVPAGSVEDGETPLAAARRELREEVGATGGTWTHLTTFFSSSAHISLRSDAFLAEGVVLGQPAPDAHERLELVRLPVDEAVTRARTGALAEGQTALTILLAAERLALR